MAKLRVNIDGKEVKGYPGQTILQIARENGVEIPTLCYDERVEIYGACGLCIVEVEGNPKLVRACATVISDGMVVRTNTQKVKQSRQTALDLLLSDHTGDCRPPCSLACPAGTDCQGYVGLIANGQYKEATELIKEKIPLPASIGRVCPHPCETACRRQLVEEPISIAFLKSFAADMDLNGDSYMPEIKPETGKKVSIIGGGPAGLTAAYFLRREGHRVVVYDSMPKMGGMLRYGIPEYRLPKELLDKEIELIKKLGGIKFINNHNIGKDLIFSQIKNSSDAVLVATGAWTSTKMRVPGEDLEGVIGGIDFLRKVSLGEPVFMGKKVAIVGGGNTAMDACRTAIRLGADKVYNIYRRTRDEMPAEDIEIIEAEEEGVEFKYLTNPIEFKGENGKLKSVRLQKMELGEPDASGRRSPKPIPGQEEGLLVDCVIMALGQILNPEGLDGIELTKKGTISADEFTFRTNIEGVFAVGDATNKGAGIAIAAIGEAQKASKVISSYLAGETVPYLKPFLVERDDLTEENFVERERIPRAKMRHLSAKERKDNFHEVNKGFSEEEAKKEASRCLECGCHDYFECKLIKYANEYDVKPEKYKGEHHNRKVNNDHPFIERNPDKCVLCGLCIRVCDEVMGRTALGLVDRGFNSIVKPALDLPLKETDCISCGQCVNLCPTGALGEKMHVPKSVPLATKTTETICSFCSVGCKTEIHTKGNIMFKSRPDNEHNGLLCVKGRFGFNYSQNDQRLKTPLIKKDGVFVPASWEEASMFIAKKMEAIATRYGNNALAVSVSDRLTNEEIYTAKKYGNEVLKTDNVFSFNGMFSGLKEVIGHDGSTNTFEELISTDLIILLCTDMMNEHATLSPTIKKAVENGAKLIVITEHDTFGVDMWADLKIYAKSNMKLLKGILKALIDMGCTPKNAEGFNDLKIHLTGYEVSDEAMQVAKMYKEAKKAMIVFQEFKINSDAAKAVADIAVVSGHIGSPRDGIIQLKPNCNSQGLSDLGVSVGVRKMIRSINTKEVKGLIMFGEDILSADLEGLEFLAVQDVYMTKTAKLADVVLPANTLLESEGTINNAERKIQKVNQVIPSLIKYSNWEVIQNLANTLTPTFKFKNTDEIYKEITENNPIFRNDHKDVLCMEGFYHEDGKAHLCSIIDKSLFSPRENTNIMQNEFVAYLKEEKVIKEY